MPAARSVAIAATPLVAMAILGLGLRLGAGQSVRAAIVRAAPPAASDKGLAWQIETLEEDEGVRKPVAIASLEVTAQSGGREAKWTGASNDDGVAEAWLDLPGVKPGDPIEVLVTDATTGERLAGEYARWQDVASPVSAEPAWVPRSRRVGAIGLDVAIYGGKLASETPAVVWVRATDAASGAPVADATIAASGEGLTFEHPSATTDARGWARLDVMPLGLVYDLTLHARAGDARQGDWAGALPSAPGGSGVSMPWRLVPNVQQTFEITAPSKRDTAYVEIDDDTGRVAAEARPFRLDAATKRLHASFDVPRLPPGLYRLVVAGDPRGGETQSASAMQWPFLVADTDDAAIALAPPVCRAPGADAARIVGWCLALEAPHAIAKWTAIDGFTAKHGVEAQRRLQGFVVAFASLAVAAVLEALLILGVVSDERKKMRSVQELEAVREGGAGRRVVIGVLVGLLGFGMVAMLVLRGG